MSARCLIPILLAAATCCAQSARAQHFPLEPEGAAQVGTRGTGDLVSRTLTVGGLERRYLLYVPSDYSGEEDWPLVISFHGWSWTPESHATFDRLDLVADTAHFLIAYPAGLPIQIAFGTNRGWNIDGSFGDWDDFAFVNQLIDDVDLAYGVDLARVHATGYSFGSMMSFATACRLNHRIASIASWDGPLPELYFDEGECGFRHVLSVMEFHGTDDYYHPYTGVWRDAYAPRPVPETFEYWAGRIGCDETPIETELPDLDPGDGTTVTRFEYTNCAYDDAEVIHYRINDGGHTWPGYPSNCTNCGKANRDVDLESLVWDFFVRHPHPDPFDLPAWIQYSHMDITDLSLGPVAFFDADSGIAVDLDYSSDQSGVGSILVTRDGGETWHPRSFPSTPGLSDVAISAGGTAIAVGGHEAILRSTDRGETWTLVSAPSPTAGDLSAVAFADEEIVVAVGGWGRVMCSVDAGLTWEQHGPVGADLADVAFFDANTGLATTCVGNEGAVLRTTDAGVTWTPGPALPVLTSCPIRVVVGGPDTAILLLEQSVLRTTDRGASWSWVVDGRPGWWASDGVFLDSERGILVGAVWPTHGMNNGGTILVTRDGGASWFTPAGLEPTGWLAYWTVAARNDDQIVVMGLGFEGEFSMRFAFGDLAQTGTASEPLTARSLPHDVLLAQNYPNPFNPTTTIAFDLPTTSDVTLAVYDALGRRVATLVDGLRAAGRHEVRFNAAGLPSGVYLVALHVGSVLQTRTMVLLR